MNKELVLSEVPLKIPGFTDYLPTNELLTVNETRGVTSYQFDTLSSFTFVPSWVAAIPNNKEEEREVHSVAGVLFAQLSWVQQDHDQTKPSQPPLPSGYDLHL